MDEKKKGPKGTLKSPWSLSYGHLLEPFPHDFLQEVKGYVVGLIPKK
jgi:hypothetical protein